MVPGSPRVSVSVPAEKRMGSNFEPDRGIIIAANSNIFSDFDTFDQRCQGTCQATQNMRCQGCRGERSILKPSILMSVKACQGKVAVCQGVKVSVFAFDESRQFFVFCSLSKSFCSSAVLFMQKKHSVTFLRLK